MDRSEQENESREGSVGGDRLEPVVVEIRQHHLRLTRSKNLNEIEVSRNQYTMEKDSRDHQTSPASCKPGTAAAAPNP